MSTHNTDRELVDRELRNFGISPKLYEAMLVASFKKIPYEKAKEMDTAGMTLKKRIREAADSYIGPEGIVHEEPSEHTYILSITETGEFLDRIKSLAYGMQHIMHDRR